jgi:hypothetical protein
MIKNPFGIRIVGSEALLGKNERKAIPVACCPIFVR